MSTEATTSTAPAPAPTPGPVDSPVAVRDATHVPTRLVWPASRFYWSITGSTREASLGRARPSRDYLDSLAEDDLPLPLELLHVVHVPVGDGRFLACAIPKAEIEALRGHTISLTPREIPSDLGLGSTLGLGTTLPELLVREYEPTTIVRERSKRWLLATAACLACTALGVLGLSRRAGADLLQAAHLREAAITRAQSAHPGLSSNLQLALGTLERELDELRPTHASDAALARSPDAGATLAQVLAHLPRTTSLRTDVLAVTPATITLNVATDADPQPFLRSLVAPEGWTLAEPRLTVRKNDASAVDTTLALQMRRNAGGSGDAGGTP